MSLAFGATDTAMTEKASGSELSAWLGGENPSEAELDAWMKSNNPKVISEEVAVGP